MPALGRLDAILTAVAPDMRDSEAGARTDDGDRPGFGKRLVRAGQPLEIARVRLRDRLSHRLEIIDPYVAHDTELLVSQRGAPVPRSAARSGGHACVGTFRSCRPLD